MAIKSFAFKESIRIDNFVRKTDVPTPVTSAVQTDDATVTTLQELIIAPDRTYFVEAIIAARRTGGVAGTADDGAVYIRRAMVTTKLGVVTINAVQDGLTQEDQAGWDATFDVSGTTLRVRVTGAVGNGINWVSFLSYAIAT